MKPTQKLLMGIVAAGTLSLALPTQGAFDQNVTPDVIFGTGNGNGFFTVEQANGVELGLRAKIPFTGIYNSGGDGTYTFQAGTLWNLEWSINSNYDNTGVNLNALTYGLFVNGLPVGGFDPVNQTYLDNSIGNNSTGNGAGVEAAGDNLTEKATEYAALIAANNVAQNSWAATLWGIDENLNGTYVFRLESSNDAATEMTVNVVPEPSTYLAGALLLLPFGISTIRKLRKGRTA